MVLVELVSADDETAVDITGERTRADELVTANRLYRQTALATGVQSALVGKESPKAALATPKAAMEALTV